MGWDGMGWDGMGWDGERNGRNGLEFYMIIFNFSYFALRRLFQSDHTYT
jgi:hypothetical protein